MKTTVIAALIILALLWVLPLLFKLFLGLFIVAVALAIYNGHGPALIELINEKAGLAWAWAKSLVTR